jgi:alginate O-acetyltransferase complex protein AlgI
MLALIAIALVAMKAVVAVGERSRGVAPLSFGRWTGFAALWPGMQPRLFAAPGKGALRGAGDLIGRGIVRLAFGALLLGLGRLAWTSLHSRLVASICLLAGLSFVLHFGLCNLLAGVWRARGIPCEALFRAPLRSQNLAEFWARRWNLAFSEMTSIAVYRPLAAVLGRGPALMAAFLVSGLLHEMAISVPVRAGFGLPLLYFALHGSLVLAERALAEAGRPIGGPLGRAWAVFWLVAPLSLLFHRPFLAGVVWPMVGIPAEG